MLSKAQLADLLGERWKCQFVRSGDGFSFDYALVREEKEVTALCDVYLRDEPWVHYQKRWGFPITLTRLSGIKMYAEHVKVPYIVVVHSTQDNSIHYVRISKFDHYKDAFLHDDEPHVNIHIDDFLEMSPP